MGIMGHTSPSQKPPDPELRLRPSCDLDHQSAYSPFRGIPTDVYPSRAARTTLCHCRDHAAHLRRLGCQGSPTGFDTLILMYLVLTYLLSYLQQPSMPRVVTPEQSHQAIHTLHVQARRPNVKVQKLDGDTLAM